MHTDTIVHFLFLASAQIINPSEERRSNRHAFNVGTVAAYARADDSTIDSHTTYAEVCTVTLRSISIFLSPAGSRALLV